MRAIANIHITHIICDLCTFRWIAIFGTCKLSVAIANRGAINYLTASNGSRTIIENAEITIHDVV